MPPPRFFYPDTPDLPLPEKHRFPISKYRLLRDKVVSEGVLGDAGLVPSPPISIDNLLHAHTADYVTKVLNGALSRDEQRRIGLPWSTRWPGDPAPPLGGHWRRRANRYLRAYRGNWRVVHTTPIATSAQDIAYSTIWRLQRLRCWLRDWSGALRFSISMFIRVMATRPSWPTSLPSS